MTRSDATRPARAPTLIVGVGASAGGLESLERLFGHAAVDDRLGFVVVQHLSPKHKSAMAELLARRTALTVCTAEDRMAVRAGTIHLLPPGKDMIFSAGRLLLADRDDSGPSLPIDQFFNSLAEELGDRAVAVVLSGTGSDGSRGAAAVKAAGGLVISESEATAKFTGMPQSAVATGCVDYQLAPEQIPQTLARHLQRRADGGRLGEIDAPADSASADVLRLLYRRYGIDFTHYKPSTVGRRIERRIDLSAAADVDEYLAWLQRNPDEVEALYHDLLIGVTQFFRDPACFDALEHEALPRLRQRLNDGEAIRVWVVGCATGEEAYSLAILLYEQIAESDQPPDIKIFATDLHPKSLAEAARGVYPPERMEGVSEARRNEHFERHPDGWRVKDHLRRLVVFARHNVLKDAPFTKLHLISCRNLLIYFRPAAQRKALTLFHFALRPQGVLMIGPSETLGALSAEFASLDASTKLFRKQHDARPLSGLPLDLPSLLPEPTPRARPKQVYQETVEAGLLGAYDALLSRFMPPALLVNERFEIVDSYGGVARLLHFAERRPTRDLIAALNPPRGAGLTGALRKAQHERIGVTLDGVRLRDGAGVEADYRLTVEPVHTERHPANYLLLTFANDGPAPPRPAAPGDGAGTAQSTDAYDAIETELRNTRESLQATIEELESSNEELQATNEELVASNEELQSSNEELNSVNEELHTVNAEYQNTIDELRELNEDMNHLLASTDIGTVFLDRTLKIRRFTPGIGRAFQLTAGDIGRPIDTFAHRLDIDALYKKLRRVLATGQLFEQEVRDHAHNALLLRLLPYQIDGQLTGVVMTVTDIRLLDEARAALADSEATLRRQLVELQTLYDTAPVGLAFTDAQDRYLRVNQRLAEINGIAVQQHLGCSVFDILPEPTAGVVGDIYRRVKTSRQAVQNVEISGTTMATGGDERDYLASYHPVFTADGGLHGVSVVVQDVSAMKRYQRALHEQQLFTRRVLDSLFVFVGICQPDGTLIEANRAALDAAGLRPDDVLGKPFPETYWWAHSTAVQQQLRDAIARAAGGETVRYDVDVRLADTQLITIDFQLTPMRDDANEVSHLIPSALNLSERDRGERGSIRSAKDS